MVTVNLSVYNGGKNQINLTSLRKLTAQGFYIETANRMFRWILPLASLV